MYTQRERRPGLCKQLLNGTKQIPETGLIQKSQITGCEQSIKAAEPGELR